MFVHRTRIAAAAATAAVLALAGCGSSAEDALPQTVPPRRRR